jgi:hypothetical protein
MEKENKFIKISPRAIAHQEKYNQTGKSTQHYVTLNVTTKDDPFVGPDIFSFKCITWEQNIDNETTE